MGRVEKEIAYWRERLRVTIEDLEDLESGKRKMAENKGEGWVDTTPHWIEKAKSDVAGLEELIRAYEELDAQGS